MPDQPTLRDFGFKDVIRLIVIRLTRRLRFAISGITGLSLVQTSQSEATATWDNPGPFELVYLHLTKNGVETQETLAAGSSSYVVGGLDYGDEILVEVGRSPGGPWKSAALTVADVTPPSAPSELVFSGDGQATLTWTASEDNVTSQSSLLYEVFRGDAPGAVTLIGETTPGALSFVDVSAIEATTYYWRIKAKDGVNLLSTSFSNEVSGSWGFPAAPTCSIATITSTLGGGQLDVVAALVDTDGDLVAPVAADGAVSGGIGAASSVTSLGADQWRWRWTSVPVGVYGSVTITARDSGDRTASDAAAFTVSFSPGTLSATPATITEGNTTQLALSSLLSGDTVLYWHLVGGVRFVIADTNHLPYTWTPDEGVYTVGATVTRNGVTVEPSTITVTANSPSNSAPMVASPIPDVTGRVGDAAYTLDLRTVFTDPQAQALTFSFPGTHTSASIDVDGFTLRVVKSAEVELDITVRATDTGSLFIEDTFHVKVSPALPATYDEYMPFMGFTNYWKLDEASGTTAADSIGAVTLTKNGTVTFAQAGIVTDGSTSFLFGGGSTARMTIPATSIISSITPKCVALYWMNANTVPADPSTDGDLTFEVGGTSQGLSHYLYKGQLYAGVYVGSANADWKGASLPITAGRDYLVAMVYDGVAGSVTLYTKDAVDGFRSAQQSGAPSSIVSSSDGGVGGGTPRNTHIDEAFNGQGIDGRMHKVAFKLGTITQEEFEAIYAKGTE